MMVIVVLVERLIFSNQTNFRLGKEFYAIFPDNTIGKLLRLIRRLQFV